jgi:hypothetical protein
VWGLCFFAGHAFLARARRSGDAATELAARRRLRPWLVVEHVAFALAIGSALVLLGLRGWSFTRAPWLGLKVGLVAGLLLPLEAMHAWICHWWVAPGLDETPAPPASKRLQRGIGMDEMLRSMAIPLLFLSLPLLVWLSITQPG